VMACGLIAAMSRPSSKAAPLRAAVEKDLRELLLVVSHGRAIVSGLPAITSAAMLVPDCCGTYEGPRDCVEASSESLVLMAKVILQLTLSNSNAKESAEPVRALSQDRWPTQQFVGTLYCAVELQVRPIPPECLPRASICGAAVLNAKASEAQRHLV
jgi:hypothetical protein